MDELPTGSLSENLAEDRTILANERTFAGWMRTSLACVAIGVGFNALLKSMEPLWIPRVIATAYLLLSIGVIILAERRAAAVSRRLSPHVVEAAEPVNLRLLAVVISLCSGGLIAAIWLIRLD
jgi:putative membrane protein